MDMDQNAALTASPREGDTAIIKTELVRSMSVADDVRDGTHLRTADRTLALTSLMKQENQLTAGAEELLRLLGRTQAQQEDENQIRKQIDVVRPAVDQPSPSKDSPPTAPVQEIRKLKELELLMDVQRVIATTDEQRKSLESMGIDVEKCLTGGALVKAISPVLLLATPHWMSRIGEVLTNRMKTELAQGDEQMQGGVPQAEAGGAAAPEGQGDEEEAPAQVLAQLLLLAVARTAAGPKVCRHGAGSGGAGKPSDAARSGGRLPRWDACPSPPTALVRAGTVALGALKHTARRKDSNQLRHICVRLWDGWMRTASLQIELEASQWLRTRATARAVLQQSPASLLTKMREEAADAAEVRGRLSRRKVVRTSVEFG